MTLDEILGRFDKVKRVGAEHMTRCPAHEDKKASLSITEGDKGVVLTCFAGCKNEDVLKAVGLELRDLFPERERAPQREAAPEVTYEYRDEAGTLVYAVQRFPGKRFGQLSVNPETGALERGMKHVRQRVPYHLPEVAASDAVYFVEGEKDVESLRALGKVATCIVGGANAWKNEYAEFFRGKQVLIVGDKDEPGEKFALQVYRALEPVASRLWLFSAKTGKDVTDHLEAGHALEDLVLIEMQRVGSLTAPSASEWYRQKMAAPPAAETEGVTTPWPGTLGVMRPGRFHLLGGYPADGKTAVSLQFMRAACAAGRRVDFFSIEMTAEELIERIVSAYGVPYGQAQTGWIEPAFRELADQAVAEMAGWDFEIHDNTYTVEEIEDIVSSRGSDLAIIDHVHAFGHKDRFEVEQIARNLKAMAKRQRVPLLVLAHLSRARKYKSGDSAFPRPDMGRLRESGMLEAWADTVWFVWRERDPMDLPTDKGELIVAKSRFTRPTWAQLLFNGENQRWEGGYS